MKEFIYVVSNLILTNVVPPQHFLIHFFNKRNLYSFGLGAVWGDYAIEAHLCEYFELTRSRTAVRYTDRYVL